MKIIALLNPNSSYPNFLVQVTGTELTNIVGETYDKKFNVGDEIQVAAIFKRLQHIDRSKGSVSTCMMQLRALADLMESFDPVVRAVIEGEKETEVTECQS